LEAYSYQGVLARGFALVRDAQDLPVRSAAAARAAVSLDIQFADGRVPVRTDGAAPAPRPVSRTKPKSPQPSLFDD
jgi:exodeoxyribonuclease VII large subunit